MTPELQALLDDVQVSKIAEYLARRLELDEDETMLQIQFAGGRYQRMQRFVKPRAGTTRAPGLGDRARSS